MRFGLLSGGLVFTLGAILLLVVYNRVRSHLAWQHHALSRPHSNSGPGWVSTVVGAPKLAQLAHHYELTAQGSVLIVGSIALAVVTAAAVWLGWRLAGWALRPVRVLTDTARQVAQSNSLAGRLAHAGPRDDIKQLADTFDVLLTRVSRAFDGQRRFVANASHELRTPLAINQTLVDVAVRRPDATEDVRRLGESLLVVNGRHERLIEGLLALAESEQAVIERHPLDLADVAEHALDQLTGADADAAGATTIGNAGDTGNGVAGMAVRQGVTAHRRLEPAPTAGDSVLLERLVQNLVENAIRHNHADGELWVTTRSRDGQAELVVSNTGPAVRPYEIETIFQPFRRLHGDRMRSDRGSGLGLSIVRAIADAHGGSVTALPRDGGGLTVTVELPASAEEAFARALQRGIGAAAG